MDYFYDDQLRWNFGFDNPNHAAALAASLLPFLWLAGKLWTPSSSPIRLAWKSWSAILLVAGWGALGLTVSRSGLLAACAAFLWIGFRTFGEWRRRIPTVILLIVLCGAAAMSTGVLSRTAETVLEPDASALNRLTLWKGGLEMLAIAPWGVGAGNSGAFYMNWLQPLDATGGYRTMVNSYLTFLTERGLVVGGVGFAIFFALVLMLQPKRAASGIDFDAVVACQASLIAFAVAGFFSTTMETAWIWLVPLLCFSLLLGLTIRGGGLPRLPAILGMTASLGFGIVAVLWGTGTVLQLANAHSLRVRNGVLEIQGRKKPSIQVFVQPDESVMGESYGKGLRLLMENANIDLLVNLGKVPAQPASMWTLAAGEQIATPSGTPNAVFLAPPRISPGTVEQILKSYRTILIFLPGYDEDGRGEFWREIAGENPEKVSTVILPGFGNDLTQAWPEISVRLNPETIFGQKPTGHPDLSFENKVEAVGSGEVK
ncbi:MAG: O-antigen ligase family protein [Terrimicrobiaceae bacterium]|nr:O-antigen ligase family protein [Terrimicrobiaceae bacterium]